LRCGNVAGTGYFAEMLYHAYQLQDDLIAPFRYFAAGSLTFADTLASVIGFGMPRHLAASLEMVARCRLNHTRPPFGITSARVGNRDVAVREEIALPLPFGNLLHFRKDIDTAQPRILVVAPLSGHFSTLLRATVQTLLRDHDVYITDWANARDVSLEAGRFGVDEYVSYLIRFLDAIGPGGHILAVCQPCVQALVAVAVMSQDRHPATPLSMTLMAGPIDPRQSPTSVNELAVKRSLEWFEASVISAVPPRFAGSGRRVYPGFIQLVAFMAMNMERHQAAHRRLYAHLAANEYAEAAVIKSFYDEYFAVLDMTEEFYIETLDRIFQRADLANGNFTYQGRAVDPSLICRTALLTVEGGRDDICGLGQTAAAHDLCNSLRPHLKRHHLQANAGHYGVFSGRRWEREVYPAVRNFILAME
jgi:polyhydroxyalkanoate depolymerase